MRAAPRKTEAVVVRLDPGLAFGTGTHPTTALCLQMLDAMPLAGRTVIDYGCGSGILGIAALKLGAARVVAVDLDPQALARDARECRAQRRSRTGSRSRASRRGFEPATLRIREHPGGAAHRAGAGADARRACTGGDLFLSGLLKTQAYAVKAAYGVVF